MKRLYKNWHVHNILAHPLMHILNIFGMNDAANFVHDSTLPDKEF